MDADKLTKMANQIARAFEVEPHDDDRTAGVANHLDRFWDPRMRRELVATVDRDPAPLHPSVVAAVAKRRDAWAQAEATLAATMSAIPASPGAPRVRHTP